PAVIPETTSRPPTPDPRREQMNEVLARAIRTLSTTPKAAPAPSPVSGVASAATPAAAVALGAPETPPDPKIFGVVSKLSEAMRIARDARDDKDLQQAEDLMRSAREEMDSVCDKSGGGGPLCQSAGQIRAMGY